MKIILIMGLPGAGKTTLANELAKKVRSFTVIANKNINTTKKIGKLISTNYYQTEFSRDVNGVEFLSAIKNIYSMIIGAGQWHNLKSAKPGYGPTGG